VRKRNSFVDGLEIDTLRRKNADLVQQVDRLSNEVGLFPLQKMNAELKEDVSRLKRLQEILEEDLSRAVEARQDAERKLTPKAAETSSAEVDKVFEQSKQVKPPNHFRSVVGRLRCVSTAVKPSVHNTLLLYTEEGMCVASVSRE